MRLLEFFAINEVSDHAWRGLGVSKELQATIEKDDNWQGHAYEAAIAILPILAQAKEIRPNTDPRHVYEMSMEYDETYIPPVHNAITKSEKFRAALRKRAHEIKKQGGQAVRTILDMVNEFPDALPKGYVESEVIVDAGDGWKWVQVEGAENCEHEGQLMQHCGQGNHNMASLRDPQGKPHVTADLNFTTKTIKQLKGKQNSVPDMKYWDKCGELFKHLKETSGGLWQFADPMYIHSKEGWKFVDFLNEFKYAFTMFKKKDTLPDIDPDEDQAWDHIDDGGM